MKSLGSIMLDELMPRRSGAINPAKHPDEMFQLLSIPAFDRNAPDVVLGSAIGSSKQSVRPGDVLLSKIVPHIRRAWVVPPGQGLRQIASSEWIVFRGPMVYPPYLRYVLAGDHFHAQFMATVAGVGGSLMRARPERVRKIEIPLPSFDEQRMIAAILDQADALRAKRHLAIAYLDDLVPSIFLDMFGDPVANPKHWPIATLAELGDLDRGISRHRPRNDPALLGGPHPLVQTGEVANSGGYIRTFNASYSDLGLAQSKLWPAGTLCITIAANIGKTGILEFDACFPDSVVGFTSNSATVDYVRVWLGFLQATLEREAPQSAQKNINLTLLRGLPVPMPSAEAIKTFSRRVDKVEEVKVRAVTEAVRMEDLIRSLQAQAFSGQL